jgi:hypothetical protein
MADNNEALERIAGDSPPQICKTEEELAAAKAASAARFNALRDKYKKK